MKATMMMYLSQYLVRLYQTYKNHSEKVFSSIIDSVINLTVNISTYNPLTGGIYNKLSKELNYSKNVELIFQISMIMDVLNGVWSDIYIL